MHATGCVRVRGYHKTRHKGTEGRSEGEVTRGAVVALFGMRSADAARKLGISKSTLQRICRRLGIERWPCKTRREAAEAVALSFLCD